ncbi:hypothetical protein Tco_0290060 [Tanacetum coccineum]
MIVESIHLRFDEFKEMYETSVANVTSGLVPQRQKASDYDNPDPAPELQNVYPSADTTVPSNNRTISVISMCITSNQPRDTNTAGRKDHLINSIRGIHPSQCKQARQLQLIPECVMFALTFARLRRSGSLSHMLSHKSISKVPDGRENGISNGPLKEEYYVAQPDDSCYPDSSRQVLSV